MSESMEMSIASTIRRAVRRGGVRFWRSEEFEGGRTAVEHALSRLELADAALNAGDPITACEHWQMARMAFLDAGMKADGDRIDHRMRANGCPTDWVLTDF